MAKKSETDIDTRGVDKRKYTGSEWLIQTQRRETCEGSTDKATGEEICGVRVVDTNIEKREICEGSTGGAICGRI